MKNIQLKQNGRFYYGWIIVLLGFLLMFFAYVGCVSLTSVFLLPVTEELGIERSTWMSYMILSSLTSVVASPIIGKFMQKGHIRILMAIFCALGIIGIIGYSRADSMADFYLFGVVVGLAFAGTAPMPVSILINRWFGGKIRGIATGLAFIGSGLGGMVLSPIMNLVVYTWNWRVGYMCIAAIFVVLTILILLLANENPASKGFTRMGEIEEEKGGNSVTTGKTLKEAMRTPELYMVIISIVMVITASTAILGNSVAYFVECGIDTGKAATFHGLILGSLVIGKPLCGYLTDRKGIKFSAVLSTVIFAGTFACLFIMPVSPFMLIFAVIACYGLGGATITIVPPLMINGLFGEKDYGTLVGITNMAAGIGSACGGTVAATVYDVTGSYSTFWMVACLFVLGAAFLRFLAFKLHDRREKKNIVSSLS